MRAFFRYLVRLIFGGPAAGSGRPTLVKRTEGAFAGDAGHVIRNACEVAVYDDRTDEPLSGIAVRFEVVSGPAEFSPGSTTVVVRTGADGGAATDVVLREKGAAVVSVHLVDDEHQSFGFAGHSEGMVHDIMIYTECAFSVTEEHLEVRLHAVDFRGDPVNGAEIEIEASQLPDLSMFTAADELGAGEYEATLAIRGSGAWSVSAQDTATLTVARRVVCACAGPPHEIRVVGEQNPRVAGDRDELLLRAVVLDRYGNHLDPHAIRGTVGDGPLEPVFSYEEVGFSLRHAGHGEVPVELSVAGSDLSLQYVAQFPAMLLEDPGLVEVGSSHQTPVLLFPAPDQGLHEATMTVRYDPELVSIESFVPAELPGGTVVRMEDTDGVGETVVSLTSEDGFTATEYPEGIEIGWVYWTCRAEGETCLSYSVAMSPERGPWDLCFEQKILHTRPLTFCVNVIYKAGDVAAKDRGKRGAEYIDDIISSTRNLAKCCPKVSVAYHSCALGAAGWRAVRVLIGADGNVSTGFEFRSLARSVTAVHCRRDNCLNVYMLPNSGGARGRANADNRVVTVDPTAPRNTFVHEVGHALGLPDKGDRTAPAADPDRRRGPLGHLMSWARRNEKRHTLTKEECREIHDNIGRYSG